jgi:endonuclease-3 related protein
MPADLIAAANTALAAHYGAQPLPRRPGEWRTLVAVVLRHSGRARRAIDWSLLEETPIGAPAEAAESSPGRLAVALESAELPAKAGRTLYGLAVWWQRRIESPDASENSWLENREQFAGELRGIPGVSHELADRILLFAGGVPVMPISRALIRVAGRHGWVDPQADYDEWQAFFARGLEGGVDAAQLSEWVARVGRDFCGREPHCDECPLAPLLPPRGPVPLGEEEECA